MQKKYLYPVAGVLIVAILGVLAWYQGFLGGERSLWRQIKDKPELMALYDKAKDKEKRIKDNPEDVPVYLSLALDWKSLGEQGGPEEFFKKSLAVYEKGIERFGTKNILFYLNGGNVAERIEDFAKAEEYFKKAIEISPADESGYLELAELYEYKSKRPKEAVVAVFKAGQDKMLNPAPIVAARAAYLRRQGDYAAALVDYKLLSLNFPNNAGYKEVVAELETKLK